jgi:hypothetical protein
MGSKTKTVGGSKGGKGLSDDFVAALGELLNGGQTGRPAGGGAIESTRGITGVLSDILAGGAGNVGGSLATLLERSQERNVNNIRARFGAEGGMGFGTPGASAEALYRAEAAPQIATQVGSLQLQTLSPLLAQLGNIYSHETPQAQTVQQKSALGQVVDVAGQLAPVAASFFTPGLAPVTSTALKSQRGNRTQMGY